MTDLQAALGTSQMSRLDEFVTRRHQLAVRYDEALADLPLTVPWQHPEGYSAFHLYVVRTDKRIRRRLFDSLRRANIGVNVHYIPVHTQPYYRKTGFTEGMFPESEKYYSEAVSLPMFADLTAAQQDRVIAALHDFFKDDTLLKELT
jgi:dTDP-4-amino-4,6-dideoxygalactose transaminase